MKKRYFLTLLMSFTLISGCNNTVVITNNSGKPVTFNVQVNKSVLSNKRDLEARIYNDEQIKISEQTANCSVSFDSATQKETVNCPPGVVYKKSEPEIFKFKVDEIKDNITMKSTSVKSGQRYLLTLSGMSSDNCNTASARVEKSSASEQENIKDLQWAQTELGCVNQ